MRHRQGFTLIELLVVIIIIVILAGATISLMGVFLRGQGVNQGGMIVTQAVAQAKAGAAEKHKYHFLVFSKAQTGGGAVAEADQTGWLEIHIDRNNDGVYQGDQDPTSKDADESVLQHPIMLPKFVVFEYAPEWISFAPSGYMSFGGGFQEIQASSFDANMSGSNPSIVGDVILRIASQPYYMSLDLDRASGKVRRFVFINKSQ